MPQFLLCVCCFAGPPRTEGDFSMHFRKKTCSAKGRNLLVCTTESPMNCAFRRGRVVYGRMRGAGTEDGGPGMKRGRVCQISKIVLPVEESSDRKGPGVFRTGRRADLLQKTPTFPRHLDHAGMMQRSAYAASAFDAVSMLLAEKVPENRGTSALASRKNQSDGNHRTG